MKYAGQKHILVAVDCIVFGFDGSDIRLLLVQRPLEPEKFQWSLMGGFLRPDETLDEAANRVLQQRTGLQGVYLEQLHTFSDPQRDPIERTVSAAFFALIDIHQYEKQLSREYHAEWFLIKEVPALIFDHDRMLQMAKRALRYKAALHPILFELLPKKFTIPQLQKLYQEVYQARFDNRNFSRKVLSSGLLKKQKDKDRANSKKGAFYYKLDKRKYKANFHSLITLIPNPDKFF